jgi:recombinational DNA repair protein RecR
MSLSDLEALAEALSMSTGTPAKCKACNASGYDTPCAYPTEINRQQARRIAQLLEQLEDVKAQLAAANERITEYGWKLDRTNWGA